jgi:hypothetical protein
VGLVSLLLAAGAVGVAIVAITAARRAGVRAAQADARLEAERQERAGRDAVVAVMTGLLARSRPLVDRQIDLLIGMEEREADAEQLSRLFELDHLAVRLRREAETALALAGHGAPPRWGRAVALVDVARAAVAETADYRRVDVAVDEHVAVPGRAVAELAHLVAELVDLALASSRAGDGDRVRVSSAARGDGACVVTVEPESGFVPPDGGLALDVVGGLAGRLGVQVQLDPVPGLVIGTDLLAPIDATVLA